MNNTGAMRVLTAWGRHGRRFARLSQHLSSAETKAGLWPLHLLSPHPAVHSEETRGAMAEEDVGEDCITQIKVLHMKQFPGLKNLAEATSSPESMMLIGIQSGRLAPGLTGAMTPRPGS